VNGLSNRKFNSGIDQHAIKSTRAIILAVSLLSVAMLAVGHAQGSTAMVLGAIGLFMLMTIVLPGEYFLPLMIFYLPWSSLLRTHPETSSFHSYALLLFLVMVLIRWLKNKGDLRTSYMALSILFIAYTLMVKFFNQLTLNPQYIFFIAMVVFVPIYLETVGEKLRFDTALLFLALGNISACIASTVFLNNPGINRFMDLSEEMMVGLRLSAFYTDPNYFSAQMLVAITGWMIIVTKSQRKRTILSGFLILGVLLYFAVQSVSKAFLLTGSLVFVLWIILLLLGKKSLLYKFYIILILITATTVVIRNRLFEEQIQFYLLRFGRVDDVSSLTTGRLGLWQVYWGYLLANLEKLAFGIGLSQDQLQIFLNTNNAHMTLIQILYQVGITGFLLLLLWWKALYRAFMDKAKMGFGDWGNMALLAVAIFIPWFGLDVLYFREFFYFPILLMLLKRYLLEGSLEAEEVHDVNISWVEVSQKREA
jgi:hypothetical protein